MFRGIKSFQRPSLQPLRTVDVCRRFTMKCIFFTVLACLAITAEPHPFFGLDIAAGIGKELGKAVSTGVGLGVGTAATIGAGALGLGASFVNGIANGVENVLGSGSVAQSASRNDEQGSSQGENQDEAESAGAYSEESHEKSEKSHHHRSHHHTSVTTITRVENSDEHDVGGSEAVEESAHKAGAFNKQSSGAGKYDNNYADASEAVEN